MTVWGAFLAGLAVIPTLAAVSLAGMYLLSRSPVTNTCWSCGVISEGDIEAVRIVRVNTHRHLPSHKWRWRQWAHEQKRLYDEGKPANRFALKWLEEEEEK